MKRRTVSKGFEPKGIDHSKIYCGDNITQSWRETKPYETKVKIAKSKHCQYYFK